MGNRETPQQYPLEFGIHIQELNPADLEVNNFLNLETTSGSRYVFRVVSKDEDGIFVEYYSGPEALEDAWGKLSENYIELDEMLDFESGTTSDLAGIVLTNGEPHDYPVPILNYNEYLEELDTRQLRQGDYLYLCAEDGLTYIAQVMDNDGKRPVVRFAAGRNENIGMEGKVKIKDFRLGMRFRNTAKSTMPIKAMFVLPDLDLSMLDELEEEYSPSELEYDKELDKLYISQLQHGDYIIIETVNSSYVLKVEEISEYMKFFEIVDGDNNRLEEKGFFIDGKIRAQRMFKYSDGDIMIKTSYIKSIKVSKWYELPEGSLVDSMCDGIEEQQHAIMALPSLNTNPGISGLHRQEIFEEFEMEPNDLAIIEPLQAIAYLQAAWKKYDAENGPMSRRDLIPYENKKLARKYKVIKEQYELMVDKLQRINEILEED